MASIKSITINPLLNVKKNKTVKHKTAREDKIALLKLLAEEKTNIIDQTTVEPIKKVIPSPPPTIIVPPPVNCLETNTAQNALPSYGCLKNGKQPTFRQQSGGQFTQKKRFSTFGKQKSGTVRVLIKNSDTYTRIEKEKKRLDKDSMVKIREYLLKRKLYKAGSTAPDSILRDIYKNAHLTGLVENTNKDVLLHNYVNGDL